MARLSTRLRTWFRNAPWPTPWRSPKEDGATARPASAPVGYLVNHPNRLTGVQGVGYDYVLGAGGLYVQSESAHLTARSLVAPAEVRGLAPVSEKLALAHGPIPAQLFRAGLRWFREAPGTERFFAVGWDGDAYRLVVPPQAGTASWDAWTPPARNSACGWASTATSPRCTGPRCSPTRNRASGWWPKFLSKPYI